ncbi:RNA polymerase sigma-70 factor [Sphingobacterium tabacisoli]|uniref:RNA polymerase sigma-70 factor n=1 Tax=Sphingobacterium tabacisoli TaxID=2044855 RepID=A0ABW5L1S6_9SPHI|nr:RNA polymerase sigma-70 factor [Sphingobacterium tabacisoli]
MTTITKGILLRIKQGDRLAFRSLYDAYAPLLYDLGFRLLRDTAAAEELVQDCFVKVWATREEIREGQDLWPLIYVMAKRLCFNQLRHARVTKRYLVQVTDVQVNDVEQRLDVRELESHLEHSIESLPEQQKRALRLSRLEGYSHQQIAVEMGISPNTVKNHITQALKNLRKTLPQADYNYLLLLSLPVVKVADYLLH